MPLLMMMHNCEYVATASTAFMEDLYDKLDQAIAASKRGFAYLHIYSPCTTGWRFPSQENIEVARKAVETNFVLLWEFNPARGLRLTRSARPAAADRRISRGAGQVPPPLARAGRAYRGLGGEERELHREAGRGPQAGTGTRGRRSGIISGGQSRERAARSLCGRISLPQNHALQRRAMERSFKAEVDKLRLGQGQTFHGEGILAVTKALLQSGVSYVGGYQGAPVSHLHGRAGATRRTTRRTGRALSRPAPTRPAPPPCSAPRSTTRCAAR